MTDVQTQPSTRLATLYRLRGIEPTSHGMRRAIDHEKLAKAAAEIEDASVADAQALVVHGGFHNSHPSWCSALTATTGIFVNYESHKGAALLLFAVDGVVYAIGYGDGHRFLSDGVKDPRFGLSYAIRSVDPGQLKDIVRRTPGAAGRTDTTLASNTLPLRALRLDVNTEIVKRLGGQLRNDTASSWTKGRRPVCVEGGVGIQARFPVASTDLVKAVRRIATTCATASPDPELEFIENIIPVTEPEVAAFLDAELDALLGMDADLSVLLSAVVPPAHLPEFQLTKSVSVTVGGATRISEALDLAEITTRTNQIRPGKRVVALRNGTISLHSEVDAGGQIIANAPAIHWLETELSKGPRRFFLHEGDWYESDADYLDRITQRVDQLVTRQPSLELPSWDADRDEATYNDWVAARCTGYTDLDRKLVRTRLHWNNGVEICDLLGPNEELIHVKRAKNSGSLSHLFAQAVNAVEHLRSPEGRSGFADKVAKHGKGRQVPEDFVPRKLVFAILLPRGKSLGECIFPFARVTLVQTVRALEAQGIDVEVIGVDPA